MKTPRFKKGNVNRNSVGRPDHGRPVSVSNQRTPDREAYRIRSARSGGQTDGKRTGRSGRQTYGNQAGRSGRQAYGNQTGRSGRQTYGNQTGRSGRQISGQQTHGKWIARLSGKKRNSQFWIMSAVVASSLTMTLSLYVYFRPSIHEKTSVFFHNISAVIKERTDVDDAGGNGPESLAAGGFSDMQAQGAGISDQSIPYLPTSGEVGQVTDLNLEPIPDDEAATYISMLPTSMGPMLYYNQGDSRWSDYLYGGQDPMKQYGCGPTAVAMIINTFSPGGMTPQGAADWAYANNCYAPQGGSYHNLIPDALTAHGLLVEGVRDRTPETAAALLESRHILIALMGKGALTDNGHFILITEYLDNGNVHIADPNSFENSTKEWDLQLLVSELKHNYDHGAPLWAVSLPSE